MALPLAIPLAAPIAPGAVAASATFAGGVIAYAAQQVYGFRAPLPPLPRVTGKAGGGTLQELVADAIAGARVAVAMPPSPFGPRGNLAVLGAQALAYAWGLLNSRPVVEETVVPVPGMQAAGTVPAAGNTVPGALSITTGAGSYLVSKQNCSPDTPATEITTSGTDTFQNVTGVSFETVAGPCGPNQLAIRLTRFQESDNVRPVLTTSWGIVSYTRPIVFSWAGPNPQPFSFPTSNLGLPSGFVLPAIVPTQEPSPSRTAPAPLPLPLPSTVPSNPEPEPQTLPAPSPLVPVTPGPAAPPVVQPGTPISPQQPKTPGSTGTTNGIVNAPARVPVPVTDPTAITPWPGAQPIPGIGTSPAPTLVGIAQEVGRIERKLEVMNNPNAPGNLVDRFGDLANLIGPIIEAILAATSGTTYTLDSPCEVDAEGDRLPAIEVEAPGAPTQFGAILNRIDALAELLQVHKDLKQPNCRGADVPVGGEFVTVNFEQID